VTPRQRSLLAAAGTGIQVGLALVASRFVVAQLGPFSLAWLRYAIGIFFLLPFLLAMPRPRFARGDLLPIAVLGVIQFGLLIALLNFALARIPAGLTALLFATFPLQAMVMAAAMKLERLGLASAAGATLGLIGVALALGERLMLAQDQAADWLGIAAALAAGGCGALCAILYRPYLQRYPTLPVGAVAMAAAALALLPPALIEGMPAALPALAAEHWGAVLFIALASGAGYPMWLYALRHAPATQASMFQSLSPITAAILGALILGEAVSPGAIAGLAVVVLGLWLALWTRPPVQAQALPTPSTSGTNRTGNNVSL